jgi:hypothetical protein
METVILQDMEKLLSPIEQAKLVGIIKEPTQLADNQKQNYIAYGIIITYTLILGTFLISHFVEKNKQKKQSVSA